MFCVEIKNIQKTTQACMAHLNKLIVNFIIRVDLSVQSLLALLSPLSSSLLSSYTPVPSEASSASLFCKKFVTPK